jgi:hypothetical protein
MSKLKQHRVKKHLPEYSRNELEQYLTDGIEEVSKRGELALLDNLHSTQTQEAYLAGLGTGQKQILALMVENAKIDEWFFEYYARLHYLQGALVFGAGKAVMVAIQQIAPLLVDLLHRADVINRRWSLTQPGVVIDVNHLLDLRDAMARAESGQGTVDDVIDAFPDMDKRQSHIYEVLKNPIGGKVDAATRIARRANELRPADSVSKITWREVFRTILREWTEKIASGAHDDIDRQIFQDLSSGSEEGKEEGKIDYIKKTWQNRYS